MPQKTHRIEQVNDLIGRLFGEVINEELELPEGALVTITNVKTSRDFRHAKIGLSIYPKIHEDSIFSLICRNLKFLKHLLHQEIVLRVSPDIKLYLDETAEKAMKLDETLTRISPRIKPESNGDDAISPATQSLG